MLRLCDSEDKGETSSDANCFLYCSNTNCISDCKMCKCLPSSKTETSPVAVDGSTVLPDTIWTPRSLRLRAQCLQMLSVSHILDARLFYLCFWVAIDWRSASPSLDAHRTKETSGCTGSLQRLLVEIHRTQYRRSSWFLCTFLAHPTRQRPPCA